jgi:hypothetical protein
MTGMLQNSRALMAQICNMDGHWDDDDDDVEGEDEADYYERLYRIGVLEPRSP